MPTSSLTDRLEETLSAFDGPDPLTTREVAERLDLGRRGTYSRLRRLADRGDVETKKVGARGRIWWRPAEGSRTDGGDGAARGTTERPRRPDRELTDVEVELVKAVERIDDGFYALDDEWRFTYVNDRTVETTGYSEEELVGAEIWETFTELEGTAAEEKCREAMATGRPIAYEDYLAQTDEWYDVRLFPSESGLSVYFQDVTERKERQRALRESERRNRTLVDNFPNGVIALFDSDLRHTLVGGELFEVVDQTREEVEGMTVDEIFPPDIAEDVEPHFRAVFDGERREFEVEAGGRVREYRTIPVRDEEGEIVAGLGMSQDVSERRRRQRELERQRERLAALNDLHGVVREVVDAVIEQSTREEIESVVCERLARSDSYRSAWIGEVDPQTESVHVRTGDGVEDATGGDATIADLAEGRDAGPTVRAFRDREVQVIRDGRAGSGSHRRDDPLRASGVRATVAIPIHHDGTRFGVVTVHADRPDAFAEDEQALVGQLGEVVGQAIAGVERKRALMSDEVVETVFVVEDVFEAFGVPVEYDGTVVLDRTVAIGDGSFLAYGSATEEGVEVIDEIVDAGSVPYWDSLEVVGTDGEERRFELGMTDPPVLTTVATYGAQVQEMWVEGGDYYSRFRLPPSRNVRHVLDAVRAVYPGVELLSRRQVSRDDDDPSMDARAAAGEDLTDRQRVVVETAFNSGYFEWPRQRDGEAVAAALGIDPSTFHYHLRNAQRETLGRVIEAWHGP